MQQMEITVANAVGLHARPAAVLVQTAKAFEADIAVEKAGRKVSAKSLISVLSLAVKNGERIAVYADGVDEAAALDAIRQLAANHFHEPT